MCLKEFSSHEPLLIGTTNLLYMYKLYAVISCISFTTVCYAMVCNLKICYEIFLQWYDICLQCFDKLTRKAQWYVMVCKRFEQNRLGMQGFYFFRRCKKKSLPLCNVNYIEYISSWNVVCYAKICYDEWESNDMHAIVNCAIRFQWYGMRLQCFGKF